MTSFEWFPAFEGVLDTGFVDDAFLHLMAGLRAKATDWMNFTAIRRRTCLVARGSRLTTRSTCVHS